MESRIWYGKPDKKGVRRSKTYKAKSGAEYYILMHKEERWAKIVNAKRRNVIDTVSCQNYNQLRLSARRALMKMGVSFEIEFKPSMEKHAKDLHERATKAYRAKKGLDY